MVREEIREWRFCSWHEHTRSCLEYIKSIVSCVERDLLGKCSITDENSKEDMSEGITMINFRQRIRDEIKKHNFPEDIRRHIEPCLKTFEKYMEYNLGLGISEDYPTEDDFFDAGYRILDYTGEEKEDVKYKNWKPIGLEVTWNDIKDNDFVIQVIKEMELPMLYDSSYYSIGFIAKQELDINEDEFLSYVTGGESGLHELFKNYKTIVRFLYR